MASMAAWVGRMPVWFHVGTTLLSVALLWAHGKLARL